MANSPNLTQKVRLYISCRKLKNVEYFSKSDPFVEIFGKTQVADWSKIGRTEVIWNNLNPDFITSLELDYYFEQQQHLKFEVFDANIERNIEVKGEKIGEAQCRLGEIIGSHGQQLILTLRFPNSDITTGSLILKVEEIKEGVEEEQVLIDFTAENLVDQSSWLYFHSFKPMFHLSKLMDNGNFQRVYSSPAFFGRNLTWPRLLIDLKLLCNNDIDRPILFELCDEYYFGSITLLGSFQFKLSQCLVHPPPKFEVLQQPGDKRLGTIFLSHVEVRKLHSFLEYISGGCKINLSIAIDFTASNGDPYSPSSLHHISPFSLNQYQSALYSVSDILLNYDSDKLVPVYGFGGYINGKTSHCFPLNLKENPSVYGLDGIMAAYKTTLDKVRLDGPTLFAEVIATAVKQAEEAAVSQENQEYFILLLLTDGEFSDMRNTVDWIVRGSDAPLSIVIVGIGNADFGGMEKLDADTVPLVDSKGKRMLRDIVQFVPYRDFKGKPDMLAKEVLAEIPREIRNFFYIKGIVPNPRVDVPEFSEEEAKMYPELPRKNAGYSYEPPKETGAGSYQRFQ